MLTNLLIIGAVLVIVGVYMLIIKRWLSNDEADQAVANQLAAFKKNTNEN
jgi:hypothetical protein